MIAHTKKTKLDKSFYWKVIFDRTIALLLLIPAIPILIVLGFLIILTSKGPAMFLQTRVGKRGKRFTMFKLRSMHVDAESEQGPTWAKENDPRTTWLGRYLRKFHLDEIPQLFNVLRGEMSLVGPRPERPEFVEMLKEKIPYYTDRLHTLPGITGLAQLNLPADSNIDSVRKKQMLDIEYLHNVTLWLDFRIFLGTFGRLLKFPESILLKTLGLSRSTTTSTFNPHLITQGNFPHELMVSERIVYDRIFPTHLEGKQYS